MPKSYPKKSNLFLVATILLLIAIPISVIGTQSINDIRNRAAEDPSVLEETTKPPVCQLIFDQKNTENIPQDSSIGFVLWGINYDTGIKESKVEITDYEGNKETLEWSFENEESIVINKNNNPPLVYSFSETGNYSIVATVTDSNGKTIKCDQLPEKKINIVIPGDNGSPVFTTDPYTQSNPGTSIDIAETYSYTIEANDPDNDTPVEYYIINDTGWLSFTEEQNSDGNFKGVFSGTPENAGSYTVVISLNDGFHNHYSTQIWVINVNNPVNDIPQLEIVTPAQEANFENNQNVKIQWIVTDNNLIERFDVYLSTNPSDRTTWIPIATNLAYNFDSFIWDTGSTPNGEYYFIVEAFDNQNPTGTGHGVSNPFTVGTTIDITPIPESYPRITNMKPENKSTTTNNQPLISADLFASDNCTITEDNLIMTLNDTPITDLVEIRGVEESEGSIIYTPDQPIADGSHKVSIEFYDSSGKKGEKTWTFTIEDQAHDADPDDNDDIISFLGIKISKRIAVILGIGIALLILAVSIPWLFYAAWKRSEDKEWTPPEPEKVFDKKEAQPWKPLTDTTETLEPETPIVIDTPTKPDVGPEHLTTNDDPTDLPDEPLQPPMVPPIAH